MIADCSACLGVGGPESELDVTAIVWAETLVSIMLTSHGGCNQAPPALAAHHCDCNTLLRWQHCVARSSREQQRDGN